MTVLLAVLAFASPTHADTGCQTTKCLRRVQAKRERLAIRRVTPYRCSFGRSAIPCAVTWCESKGRWDAYNPSGAASIYQLMPVHRRPWPVRSRRDRLAHHRIAYRLYSGGAGAGHWVCKG